MGFLDCREACRSVFKLDYLFFLITFLQSIIFLVFVCLLLMDFFGQVCLRLAWAGRCNTWLTGLAFIRRLLLKLLFFFHVSSFIIFAKGSTHFLLFASTISFSVCTTVLYSFFIYFKVIM